MSTINMDQLLPEYAFIRYCNSEPVGSGRRLNVTPEFIEAAKKDGLIKPLFRVSEEIIGEGGPTKQMVEYYSPHQLFIMVGLRENVLKEGRLESQEPRVFRGTEPMRTLMWGSMGYTVFAENSKPMGQLPQLNLSSIAGKFHKFIKLLHQYPPADRYDHYKHNRGRLLNGATNARINFDGLDQAELKKYGLSIGDLRLLRQAIGSLATSIDPLEHWLYYLQKHSQRRKDVFKGDAGLAQELYLTENLITDVIEKVSGEKQPPLIEFLYQGGPRPFMLPSLEYARGSDAAAIKSAIDNLRVWAAESKNHKLLPKNFDQRLDAIEDNLKGFVEKYKDRSYLHNEPRSLEYEDWQIDDLDEHSQSEVKAMIQAWESNHSTDQDDDGLSPEEQREQERQYLIYNAIEGRLTEVQRELYQLSGEIRDTIAEKTDEGWRAYTPCLLPLYEES